MSDQEMRPKEQQAIEDWLVYRANDHVLMTSYERSMYSKVLAELARLRKYEKKSRKARS